MNESLILFPHPGKGRATQFGGGSSPYFCAVPLARGLRPILISFRILILGRSMSESCFTSEIYALYVIGSLDGEDLSEFSRHIRQGCEVCSSQLTQARELWTSVAA